MLSSYVWGQGRGMAGPPKLSALARSGATLAAGAAVVLVASLVVYPILAGTVATGLTPTHALISVEIIALVVLAVMLAFLSLHRLPVLAAAHSVSRHAAVAIVVSAVVAGAVMLFAGPSRLEGVAILMLALVLAATAIVRASVILITEAAGSTSRATPARQDRDYGEGLDLVTVMQGLAGDLVVRTGAQACRLFTVSSDNGALVLRGEARRDPTDADGESSRLPRERLPVAHLPWLTRLLQRDGWLHVPADIVATGGIGYELTRTLAPDRPPGDLSLRALRIADAPIGVVCLVHPFGTSSNARVQYQRSADRALDAAGPAIERASRLRALSVRAGWWSAVMRELPYGVAVVNRGTRLVSFNPAAEAAVAIARDQVLGKRLCERPISCMCPLHVTLRTGEGRQVPLSSIWPFPLAPAAAGQLVNIWATTNSGDESDMVVIALSATSGRDPAPGIGTEVAAMISHELRAPLATLRASSELALEELDDPERQRGLLSTISRQVDRLDHLVQELADVFRLQAGKLQLNREVLDLPELCQELVDEINEVGTHHQLVVLADQPVGTVAADRLKIRTVLSNLLGNATKYAPQHTQVTITVQDAGDRLEVTVQDEGAGIAAEDVPHIFEQFYRSKSAATVTKGYGLGLYITRALVELHGGQIRVENGAEGGCRFTFVLPRRLDRLPAALDQAG